MKGAVNNAYFMTYRLLITPLNQLLFFKRKIMNPIMAGNRKMKFTFKLLE